MSRNQVQLNPGFDLPVHTRWYLGVVLFQPPSPELDVRLSPHPALQFPVRHGAFRVVSWLGYCLTCSPSPCIGHYPDHLSTTGTPSPWVSQPLGDPEFSPVRRIVRLGTRSSVSPFVTGHSPQRVFHSKQRIRVIAVSPVPGKLRWMECCIVSDLGSANSASPCVQGRVGGQRGAVFGAFDLPEYASGSISASPFPTAPPRTVLAPFSAHGSLVLNSLSSSLLIEQRCWYVSHRSLAYLSRTCLPSPYTWLSQASW